jgi:integrase/recombinase XerD
MAHPPTERSLLLASPSSPESVAAWIGRYLESLTVRHASRTNTAVRRSQLGRFNAWCVEHGIATPAEVTHAHLERFQRHLFYARKPNGEAYKIAGQIAVLVNVQMFYRWLVRHKHVPSNPAADIEMPKQGHSLLREPLSTAEVEAVLALPDLATPYGLRDRAILELFYATGIRRQELANLRLADIDEAQNTLMVRQGKGRKDRFIPVGERALAWIGKYRREARPHLVGDPHEPKLFLNYYGLPLSANSLSWRIRDYFDRAGVTKVGACHLFRHAMATGMLDNGADLRHVQEMLGHAMIVTTQRYTHVSIARLKAVHAATHPSATLARRGHEAESDAERA